jgi:DNA polymerase-3 subunit epsilon
MSKTFAIIDVETTGGDPKRDKLTEFAVVIHDGEKIIKSFHTLINPERSIPPFITHITGITDDMVKDAPKFYEVAKEIVEITEGAYFVAHNVRFDYGFICNEFKRLGYPYQKQTLCTVQMSRKAFPGLPSYSLGKLVKHFNISLKNHHRALDDALATTTLFEKIMKSSHFHTGVNFEVSRSMVRNIKIPTTITREYLENIPHSIGVYYLMDKSGNIVYVGKSVDLRNRIWAHFTEMSERALKLQECIGDVDYIETGSELAALLIENTEIKRLKPLFNKAQRNTSFPYVMIYDQSDINMFKIIRRELCKPHQIQIKAFQDKKIACQYFLQQLIKHECLEDNFETRTVALKIPDIIALLRKKGDLNRDWDAFIKQFLRDKSSTFLVIDSGRNEEEMYTVLVQNGQITHTGFINQNEFAADTTHLSEILNPYIFCPVAYALLQYQINKNPSLKILQMNKQPTFEDSTAYNQ